MGYAWKALALDGINKESRSELVDKVSAEIAAALAFCHNDEVFSDSPVHCGYQPTLAVVYYSTLRLPADVSCSILQYITATSRR